MKLSDADFITAKIGMLSLPISNNEGDVGDGVGHQGGLDVFRDGEGTVEQGAVGVDDLEAVMGIASARPCQGGDAEIGVVYLTTDGSPLVVLQAILLVSP